MGSSGVAPFFLVVPQDALREAAAALGQLLAVDNAIAHVRFGG